MASGSSRCFGASAGRPMPLFASAKGLRLCCTPTQEPTQMTPTTTDEPLLYACRFGRFCCRDAIEMYTISSTCPEARSPLQINGENGRKRRETVEASAAGARQELLDRD